MLRNRRLFQRQITSVPKVFNSTSTREKKKERSDVQSLIPPRINRSPTDILKALASTVGRDPTAFHYQIPDDPFLYPSSNFQSKKRISAVESGRQSARWVVKNNPGIFNHDLAEPSIKTFLNKQVFDENSEITEEVLAGLIRDRNVTEAIAVYGRLEDKGIDVSKDVKQSLLELVCFYNSSDIPDENNVIHKWYEMDKTRKIAWKGDGFERRLFENLESDCPEAYAAVIQGMLKYGNLDEAIELLAAGKNKNIKFPVGVYNLLIEKVNRLEPDLFKRFPAIEGYLTEMAEGNIKPNLGTLNSVLNAVSTIDVVPLSKKESFICKLLSEFEDLKIYPSLGTYLYLLKIFVRQDEIPEIRMVVSQAVMNRVSEKNWDIQHPSDLSFLNFAMSLFCNDFRSLKFANALMNFYSSSDHHKFLITSSAEWQFFGQYLLLIFKFAPMERAMEVYKSFVPSRMFLDSRKYSVILRCIHHRKRLEYLEEIWRDMKKYLSQQFVHMHEIIGLVICSVSDLNKENTPKVFYEAAEVLINLLDTVELESKTLEHMLITFTRFEDAEKVLTLMKYILEGDIYFMKPVPLEETFDLALSKQNIPLIKSCLELSCRENVNVRDMAKKASTLLSEADQSWLEGILKKVKQQNIEEPPLKEASENAENKKMGE